MPGRLNTSVIHVVRACAASHNVLSHGFLRVEITPKLIVGQYYEVPRPQEPYSKGSHLLDYFEFDWCKRHYVPNEL